MNKWVYRIVALVMLLFFAMLFAQLYKQLRVLQGQQEPAATSPRR